jgi:hypothetical protein
MSDVLGDSQREAFLHDLDHSLADHWKARVELATTLLEWWLATNPAEDRQTRLAKDTQAFLEGRTPDTPDIRDVTIREEWP